MVRPFDAMIARARRDYPGFDTLPSIETWRQKALAEISATGAHEGVELNDFNQFYELLRSARIRDGIGISVDDDEAEEDIDL
jgi:hypothetical protein